MNFFRKGIKVNNKTWVLVWGFWLLGGWTTKTKVWSDIWIKNAKTLFNKIFQNFDVSDKKSADFSCLFTFFQKNCKSKIFFTTFWELHNWQFWIAICLHFWNQLIYVLIQKSKQMTNSSCQLCNSQNVVKSIMNLQFFWKNVNKQLKSADFFSEASKFWKISLKKVVAFFALMSKHTLHLQIHLHNRHNG